MDKYNEIDLSNNYINSILRIVSERYNNIDINNEYFNLIVSNSNLIDQHIFLVQDYVNELDLCLHEKYNTLKLFDSQDDIDIYDSIKSSILNLENIYNNIFDLIVENKSMIFIFQEQSELLKSYTDHQSHISLRRGDTYSNIVINHSGSSPVKLYKLVSVGGKLLFFNGKFLAIK